MMQNNNKETPVDLDAYLTLFRPYEAQLRDFGGRQREYGGRFALLFRHVVRLLAQDARINRLVPKTYVAIAHRFLDRVPDTVMHFSYEDNRHFFLSELREWIAVQERGRDLRERHAGTDGSGRVTGKGS